jgi:hypothetical protein
VKLCTREELIAAARGDGSATAEPVGERLAG